MAENKKTVFITGAARRIGAAIAEHFHQCGFNIVFTYHHSVDAALALAEKLNQQRTDSCRALPFDLRETEHIDSLAKQAIACFGQVDILINNASRFYPTDFAQANHKQWQDLIQSNCQAAFFLSQAFSAQLKKQQGCIINLIDIYADKPLKNHSIYNISKAAMKMLNQSLALDLAPDIRVNGIAPGAILWPEQSNAEWEQALLANIPLAKKGRPEDIAQTAYFLANSPYITGQMIAVDGGRSLNM